MRQNLKSGEISDRRKGNVLQSLGAGFEFQKPIKYGFRKGCVSSKLIVAVNKLLKCSLFKIFH